MRHLTFTPADLAAIRHDRYHHPHPRVQQKMEVLWLKSRGCTHEDIARLGRIRRLPWKGKANDLDAYRGSLEDYFLLNPPRSTREARAAIERETGVRRGLTPVRAFLKKLSACAGARSAPSRPRRTRRSRPTS